MNLEEGNYFKNQNDWGNGWGFFVELDQPTFANPIKFKNPKKYSHSYPIAQTMETIREDIYEDSPYDADQKKGQCNYISNIFWFRYLCCSNIYLFKSLICLLVNREP